MNLSYSNVNVCVCWFPVNCCVNKSHDFWLPSSLSVPAHIWLTPLPPVRTDTKFDYDIGFFSKNLTANTHLHHPSYTNTKKVSPYAKFLLTTLIQDANRERISIYLKIYYGKMKKKSIFKIAIYCSVWTHQRNLLTLTIE